jgi:hypothetical protein
MPHQCRHADRSEEQQNTASAANKIAADALAIGTLIRVRSAAALRTLSVGGEKCSVRQCSGMSPEIVGGDAASRVRPLIRA